MPTSRRGYWCARRPSAGPSATVYPDENTYVLRVPGQAGYRFRLTDQLPDYWDGEPGPAAPSGHPGLLVLGPRQIEVSVDSAKSVVERWAYETAAAGHLRRARGRRDAAGRSRADVCGMTAVWIWSSVPAP